MCITEALQLYEDKLTPFEREEILNYPKVTLCGGFYYNANFLHYVRWNFLSPPSHKESRMPLVTSG